MRFGHTATSLSADMVLLVGGFGPHNKKHTRLDGAQLLHFVQGKNSSRWKKALNEIASSRFDSFYSDSYHLQTFSGAFPKTSSNTLFSNLLQISGIVWTSQQLRTLHLVWSRITNPVFHFFRIKTSLLVWLLLLLFFVWFVNFRQPDVSHCNQTK